jgi:hypothetical protein
VFIAPQANHGRQSTAEHLLRGIGAWVDSVPDYAMDDGPETILVAPLSGESSDQTPGRWLPRPSSPSSSDHNQPGQPRAWTAS